MSIVDKILNSVVEKGAKFATFTIKFPDGKTKKVGKGKDDFVATIKSKEVYSEVMKKGDLAMGEQYMMGNIDLTGDFSKALELSASLNLGEETHKQSFVNEFANQTITKLRPQNRHYALRNVQHHYDQGNEFYEKWLDKSLTYSCAYFKTPNDSIDKAQEQKLEYICRKLMLKKGETLVDIGSGWGSMLIYAAQKYKVKGYGVTLSKEQLEYANIKIKKLKLEKMIKLELKDYRDIKGKFDKFVSIGMFEHVGPKYYSEFFKAVKNILKPGGIGLLHTIGTLKGGNAGPFSDVYIFPGAYLPSAVMVFNPLAEFGLVPIDFENLRMHYAMTLNKWKTAYDKVFDETAKERGIEFARMWRLYLYAAAANFKAGNFQLYQFTFTNGVNNNLPLTREHLYT